MRILHVKFTNMSSEDDFEVSQVIAYFASVGASQQTAPADGEKKVHLNISRQTTSLKMFECQVTLEDQIVQTNPVLEAFGETFEFENGAK